MSGEMNLEKLPNFKANCQAILDRPPATYDRLDWIARSCIENAIQLAEEVGRLRKQKQEMIDRFQGVIGVGKDERNFVVLWIESDEDNTRLQEQATSTESEILRLGQELAASAVENEGMREASAFLLSANKSGEPVYEGHCESCDKYLAALPKDETPG